MQIVRKSRDEFTLKLSAIELAILEEATQEHPDLEADFLCRACSSNFNNFSTKFNEAKKL